MKIMKKIYLLLIAIFIKQMAYSQNQYIDSNSPAIMESGVYYQMGPGADNESYNWGYPFGTKLTINGGPYRNFELTTTNYPFGDLKFRQWNTSLNNWTQWRSIILADRYGNVGIGTTTPDSKLTVAGKIHAQEVKVTATAGGADFVFKNTYNLPKLQDVEQFIKNNKHLPEIASAKEMEENGLFLAEMNIKLLQKIEELTLYTIQQEKRIKILEIENKTQNIEQNRITQLEKKISLLMSDRK
jgi:hypothetical protein